MHDDTRAWIEIATDDQTIMVFIQGWTQRKNVYLVHSDDMGVRGFYWKFMRHRQTQMYLLSI